MSQTSKKRRELAKNLLDISANVKDAAKGLLLEEEKMDTGICGFVVV